MKLKNMVLTRMHLYHMKTKVEFKCLPLVFLLVMSNLTNFAVIIILSIPQIYGE
jgi:hypothetical protein